MEKRAEIDVECDFHNFTPLHCAANLGFTECVELLRDAGADTNKQDDKGNTPLHHAAYFDKIEAVKTLATSGHVDFKIKVNLYLSPQLRPVAEKSAAARVSL